jgi:hypothetical protein
VVVVVVRRLGALDHRRPLGLGCEPGHAVERLAAGSVVGEGRVTGAGPGDHPRRAARLHQLVEAERGRGPRRHLGPLDPRGVLLCGDGVEGEGAVAVDLETGVVPAEEGVREAQPGALAPADGDRVARRHGQDPPGVGPRHDEDRQPARRQRHGPGPGAVDGEDGAVGDRQVGEPLGRVEPAVHQVERAFGRQGDTGRRHKVGHRRAVVQLHQQVVGVARPGVAHRQPSSHRPSSHLGRSRPARPARH